MSRRSSRNLFSDAVIIPFLFVIPKLFFVVARHNDDPVLDPAVLSKMTTERSINHHRIKQVQLHLVYIFDQDPVRHNYRILSTHNNIHTNYFYGIQKIYANNKSVVAKKLLIFYVELIQIFIYVVLSIYD